MGKLLSIAEKIVEMGLKNKASLCEAFGIREKSVSIEIRPDSILGEQKIKTGFGIRVVKNNSIGFSYTTDFDEDSLSASIKTAIKLASSQKPDPHFKDLPTFQGTFKVSSFDVNIAHTSPQELLKILRDEMKSVDIPKNIHFLAFLEVVSFTRTIANSEGISASEDGTQVEFGVEATAKRGNETGLGFDEQAARTLKKINIGETSRSAFSLALMQLRKKNIEGNEMALVLSPFVFSEILNCAIVPGICANRVDERKGPFFGKLGEKVLSDNLTISDNGRVDEGFHTYIFDDEGVPSSKTLIFDKGVLNGFLYNTYYAHKRGAESTGNAVRAERLKSSRSFKVLPSIGPTNVIVKEGSYKKEDLLEELRDGLYVYQISGALNADRKSSNFSMSTQQAFKVENGEISCPTKPLRLAGNAIEILGQEPLMANDVKQCVCDYNPASYIVPSIRTCAVKAIPE